MLWEGILKFGTTELIIILVITLILFGPKLFPAFRRLIKKSKKSFKEGLEK